MRLSIACVFIHIFLIVLALFSYFCIRYICFIIFTNVRNLLVLKFRFYLYIHKLCFSIYKFSIRVLLYSVYTCLLFLNAILCYYQLVISLSNDMSEKGPIYTGQMPESSYFSFRNWNLNTLSKDNFSILPLHNAHHADRNNDIISLC